MGTVLNANKNGCLLSELQREYKSRIGEFIPYLTLGYKNLEKFLRDISDLVWLEEDAKGNKIVKIKSEYLSSKRQFWKGD